MARDFAKSAKSVISTPFSEMGGKSPKSLKSTKVDTNHLKIHDFDDFGDFFKMPSQKSESKIANKTFSSEPFAFLTSRKRVLRGYTFPWPLSLMR